MFRRELFRSRDILTAMTHVLSSISKVRGTRWLPRAMACRNGTQELQQMGAQSRAMLSHAQHTSSGLGGAAGDYADVGQRILNRVKGQTCKTKKISIIGAGELGITISAYLLGCSMAEEFVVLMDKDHAQWMKSDPMRILHGNHAMAKPEITATTHIEDTRDSNFVIIATGANATSETCYPSKQEVADVLKEFVPLLALLNPQAMFIVATHASDIMTRVTQRVAGIPPARCISAGCHLDSARFRYYIAEELGKRPTDISGFIIGAHGKLSVPVWSNVKVGDTPLTDIFPNAGIQKDPYEWYKVHERVIATGLQDWLKEKINWPMVFTVANLIKIISEGSERTLNVGILVNMKDFSGIPEHVILSFPCKVSTQGVTHIAKLPLNDLERDMLQHSAESAFKAQNSIKL